MAGFEPAASTSQMWRDTGLRYIPKIQVANIAMGINQSSPFMRKFGYSFWVEYSLNIISGKVVGSFIS
jgi:hypothetical protein